MLIIQHYNVFIHRISIIYIFTFFLDEFHEQTPHAFDHYRLHQLPIYSDHHLNWL